MLRPAPRRGITLSELLLVVTITALLSIFFIISSQYLVIRSKVARVQQEQRVLQRALGNYQMDYSDFPRNEIGLRALNAPTMYLTSLPRDPFGSGGQDGSYFYCRHPERGYYYVVVSAGPDGDVDFKEFLAAHPPDTAIDASGSAGPDPVEADSADRPTPQFRNLQDFIVQKTYDPTNGVNSDGDIISYMQE
ncbi:MAG: hypothetical protein Kow0059_21230 [Candidatus Sumerlaeia bacterium]